MIELVVHNGVLMSTKTDKVKEDFAKRLHKAMDSKGYPRRGRARILSKEFNISDKGAGKWLNGEAIPETSKIPLLAAFLDINAEWLLSVSDDLRISTPQRFKITTDSFKKINELEKKIINSINDGKITETELTVLTHITNNFISSINILVDGFIDNKN